MPGQGLWIAAAALRIAAGGGFHEKAAEQEGEEALQAARLDDVQGDSLQTAVQAHHMSASPTTALAPHPRLKRLTATSTHAINPRA